MSTPLRRASSSRGKFQVTLCRTEDCTAFIIEETVSGKSQRRAVRYTRVTADQEFDNVVRDGIIYDGIHYKEDGV